MSPDTGSLRLGTAEHIQLLLAAMRIARQALPPPLPVKTFDRLTAGASDAGSGEEEKIVKPRAAARSSALGSLARNRSAAKPMHRR